MDVLLDVKDVPLRVPLSLLLKKLQLSLSLHLQPLLPLGQLDLVFVLNFLDFLSLDGALIAPVAELNLEGHLLFLGIVHHVAVLLQLTDLHIVLLQLVVPLFPDVLYSGLELGNYLVIVLFVEFFQLLNFVLQPDSLLQLLVVLCLQLPLYLCLIRLLLAVLLVQLADLILELLDFGLLLIECRSDGGLVSGRGAF